MRIHNLDIRNVSQVRKIAGQIRTWKDSVSRPALSRTVAAAVTAVFLVVPQVYPAPAAAEDHISKIVHGGKLYDKWFKVVKAEQPSVPHPSYPESGKYRAKKGADWRCKECHGWDYKGLEGLYSEGSKHYSGIKGISASKDADVADIIAVLKNDTHAYTDEMMDPDDFEALALFVRDGQIDMDEHIDRETKKPNGDVSSGKPIYQTVCAGCHAQDGTGAVEEGAKNDWPILGKEANSNPWEVLHKIQNGQPAEQMPAMRAFDIQVSLDILAYLQTLPIER